MAPITEYSTYSYKQLKKACKVEGLDTRGTKSELIKRLNSAYRLHVLPTGDVDPEMVTITNTEDECDGVLLVSVEFGAEQNMKEEARGVFEAELDNDVLTVENTGDKVVIGNPRGLHLIQELEQMKLRLSTAEKKCVKLEHRMTDVQAHMESMKNSLDAYLLLRNRFLSTYKRDILKNATDADRRLIEAGNDWAHGGDALADAKLYTSNNMQRARRDISTYRSLYGIDPLRVASIAYQPTINVLNAHARVISSERKGSDKFYTAFDDFITLLEESDYEENYIETLNSNLAQAYFKFFDCEKYAEVDDEQV